MMQSWQTWHDTEPTDAEMAYEMMMMMPGMVEMMGMASAAELDQLEASSGEDFDQLYLRLMIDHHQGALRMLEDVTINGQEVTLEAWANDMLTGQATQIWLMEQMLAEG